MLTRKAVRRQIHFNFRYMGSVMNTGTKSTTKKSALEATSHMETSKEKIFICLVSNGVSDSKQAARQRNAKTILMARQIP